MTKSMVVLTAGMGSRYGGLKQLDQLGPDGETIIDYSVFDARRAGIDKVVFILRREFEQDFRQRVAASYERHFDVHYALQGIPAGRSKPWGTAHALLSAHEKVGEPFLVINADDFYGADAYAVGADALAAMSGAAVQVGMVGYELQNTLSANGTVSRGLCDVSASGALAKITETHGLASAPEGARDERGELHPAATVASMNFWVMNEPVMAILATKFDHFAALHAGNATAEFEMPTVVNELIDAGTCAVQVHRSSAQWSGVTYRADAAAVSAQLAAYARDGVYPRPLWQR